jgi:hypothetical protein
MPRKFWLMPGLEFHEPRAEMPPTNAPMLGFVLCVSYETLVLGYTLGLTSKQPRRTYG